MKPLPLLLLLSCLGPASGCPLGEPSVPSASTQEELERLAGVEALPSLGIYGSVTDLSPLASLRSLESLTVSNTTTLQSLAGLEQLRDPASDDEAPTLTILISLNAALTDISALSMPRLKSLELARNNAVLVDAQLSALEEAERIDIYKEPVLARFAAPALKAIHEELSIDEAPALCEVELPALSELGRLQVTGYPSCWPEEDQAALLAQTQPAE